MWGFTKMLFERAALEFGYFECGALEPGKWHSLPVTSLRFCPPETLPEASGEVALAVVSALWPSGGGRSLR